MSELRRGGSNAICIREDGVWIDEIRSFADEIGVGADETGVFLDAICVPLDEFDLICVRFFIPN